MDRTYQPSHSFPTTDEERVKAVWRLRTIEQAYPPAARPQYTSPSALEERNYLASACTNLNRAKRLMIQARDERLRNGERSEARTIQVFDIRRATQLARGPCDCAQRYAMSDSSPSCCHMELIEIVGRSSRGPWEPIEPRIRPRLEGKAMLFLPDEPRYSLAQVFEGRRRDKGDSRRVGNGT